MKIKTINPKCLNCHSADMTQIQGGGDFEVWGCKKCKEKQIFDLQDGSWIKMKENNDED